jgi:hypothetical protein
MHMLIACVHSPPPYVIVCGERAGSGSAATQQEVCGMGIGGGIAENSVSCIRCTEQSEANGREHSSGGCVLQAYIVLVLFLTYCVIQ